MESGLADVVEAGATVSDVMEGVAVKYVLGPGQRQVLALGLQQRRGRGR